MDQFQQLKHLLQPHTVHLLRSLWRHRNLQALALRISYDEIGTGGVCADLEKEIGTACWPRLRALYLHAVDQYWLQKLPMFEELQILELRDIKFLLFEVVEDLAQSISRCPYLQVVDLEVRNVGNPEIFSTMASGCPLLQRFCVKDIDNGVDIRGDHFSRLLQALPRVEILSLPVRFKMNASNLRDLVNFCSRLKVLDMGFTVLYLSLEALEEVPPLPGLRVLNLGAVRFKNPGRYAQLRSLQSIATEWSRVFPQLRRAPCPADVHGPEVHLEENSSSRDADRDDDDWSIDNDSETSLDNHGLGYDDSGSDCFHMRRRLWKILGYRMDDCHEFITRTNHMWQTDFEIGKLDWPITPLQAFMDPKAHSSV